MWKARQNPGGLTAQLWLASHHGSSQGDLNSGLASPILFTLISCSLSAEHLCKTSPPYESTIVKNSYSILAVYYYVCRWVLNNSDTLIHPMLTAAMKYTWFPFYWWGNRGSKELSDSEYVEESKHKPSSLQGKACALPLLYTSGSYPGAWFSTPCPGTYCNAWGHFWLSWPLG